jgi:hypothetical protein
MPDDFDRNASILSILCEIARQYKGQKWCIIIIRASPTEAVN